MLRNTFVMAVMVLRRRPFFTFVNLFGIGFTLLVLVTAAAILDHVFAPYPPETKGDRIVGIYGLRLEGEGSTSTGFPGYKFLHEAARNLPGAEVMAVSSMPSPTVTYADGRRIELRLRRVEADYFKVLDFEFVEGGAFLKADEEQARFVAVINEATRKKFFGTDAGTAIGREIPIEGRAYRVIGVIRDVPLFRAAAYGDVYAPMTTTLGDDYKREIRGGYMGLILLKTPGDLAVVREEFRARVKAMTLPSEFQRAFAAPETFFSNFARSLTQDYVSDDASGKLLGIMLVFAVAFMGLPALNLINLSVSRALERASEIGVRRAFGASRMDLVRQLLLENLVVCVIAGAGALVGAWILLQAVAAADVIPYARFTLNARILGWGFLFSIVFGTLSGVVPAWRLSRLQPVQALAGGTNGGRR